MNGEWKSALRLQIEALAKRNELHRKSSVDEIKKRTVDMDKRIVKLRELVGSSANDAALFYLECVCHADETERLLNRGSSVGKEKKWKKVKRKTSSSVAPPLSRTISSLPGVSSPDVIQTIDVSALEDQTPQRPHWWDQFQLYRRTDLLRFSKQNDRRELWRTQKDFFLSCLGFMVGVGHTMRFPAKVYQHGGGVFFIPYLFSLIFFGLPLVFLHLSLGQYTGQAANTAFQRLMPIGSGVGWALVVIAIPVAVYYNIIVAWAIHYFFQSAKGLLLGDELPWETCRDEWQLDNRCCNLHNLHSCFNSTNSITAPEAFFHSEVLSLSTFGDFALGPLQSHLVLSLAAAWLLVFFGVFKGLGSIAQTMNVTATVPYLLLSILLLRGISLPGANKGLTFLFTVDSTKLWKWQIWKSAAEQVFYELGIDAGPLISMAAFSRYRNNIYRDSVLLVIMDALTSCLSGMVIFSFVGFIASESNSNVNDVLKHDPLYLSFTVYPGVTSFMYWGGLWATLFFGMLVLAAIDAEFAWLEMIASAFMNHFSMKNKAVENRLLAFLCLAGFFLGLPLCAQGGIFVFHAIENLNANWNSFSLALLSVAIVCYVYGIDNYLTDISAMLRVPRIQISKATRLKEKLIYFFGPGGIYIKFSLCFICPVILTVLLVASVLGYQRISFAGRPIPIDYEIVAWIVMIGPLLVVPLVAFMQIRQIRNEGKLLKSLFDTSEWRESQDDSLEPKDLYMRQSGKFESPPNRRRTPTIFTHRENTYMYIDSRGPTVRSRVFPLGASLDPYGWKAGRLRDRQQQIEETASNYSEEDSATTNSFMASTVKHNDDMELTLFGSPPAILGDDEKIMTTRFSESMPVNYKCRNVEVPRIPNKLPQNMERMARKTRKKRSSPSASDPPVPTSPLPPPPKLQHCRSEPPMMNSKESHSPEIITPGDDSPSISNSSDDSSDDCFRRATVIRRKTSDDDAFTHFSTATAESISITPLDFPRQRSLSSVAIYDQEQKNGRSKVLSQLKRPKPIDMPPK
ncbi:Sodium-dependent transporter snf-12 [Caenorhabditis elegans]|uniref:Sodium-dependent transporter snf-12 n=1 Tax=Caenorhabditis elegans TaxID=6239 RepID=SNF12_CAEEL|nr:Sodium-dependent transporter snf-12 [Caenorhabditis elegans]CCD65393.1 Sodium-dependent transporter snf-12 [Caenorhabditis elegans]|eukprot:NP_509527.1 Transporter [Caenorhabditis elegans]